MVITFTPRRKVGFGHDFDFSRDDAEIDVASCYYIGDFGSISIDQDNTILPLFVTKFGGPNEKLVNEILDWLDSHANESWRMYFVEDAPHRGLYIGLNEAIEASVFEARFPQVCSEF